MNFFHVFSFVHHRNFYSPCGFSCWQNQYLEDFLPLPFRFNVARITSLSDIARCSTGLLLCPGESKTHMAASETFTARKSLRLYGEPCQNLRRRTRNKQHRKAVTYLPLSKNRIWFCGKWLMIKHREQNPNEKCNYRYYIDIWKVFQAIPLKLSKKKIFYWYIRKNI